MEEVLKKQTQNEFLKILQSRSKRRIRPKFKKDDLLRLASMMSMLDAPLIQIFNVQVSTKNYYEWLKEVVDLYYKKP